MFFRSSWLPSRIPYTLLLLPLFWIMLLLSPNLNEWRSLWTLLIVHGLLYAAVNGYLNFYKKSKSENQNRIGLYISLATHAVASAWSFIRMNETFAGLILLYGLAAYAYGYATREGKVSSFAAWTVVRFVQGVLTAVLYYGGLNNFPLENILNVKVLIPGVVSSLLLAAYFPYHPTILKRTFYQSVAILLAAAFITILYFSAYVSTEYIPGVIVSFVVGIVLLIQKQSASAYTTLQPGRYTLASWFAVVSLNTYAFYLFIDFTHIGQLLNGL